MEVPQKEDLDVLFSVKLSSSKLQMVRKHCRNIMQDLSALIISIFKWSALETTSSSSSLSFADEQLMSFPKASDACQATLKASKCIDITKKVGSSLSVLKIY